MWSARLPLRPPPKRSPRWHPGHTGKRTEGEDPVHTLEECWSFLKSHSWSRRGGRNQRLGRFSFFCLRQQNICLARAQFGGFHSHWSPACFSSPCLQCLHWICSWHILPQPPSLPSQKLLLHVVLSMQNDSLLCLHRLKTTFPNSPCKWPKTQPEKITYPVANITLSTMLRYLLPV